ncbi:Hypothetical predicted protein, partial [Pelobates cultripes]
MAKVLHTDINNITWSDHADITLTLGSLCYKSNWSWRLNTSLLRDDTTQATTRQAITEYFEINVTPEASPTAIWAAHKAVLRSHFIKLATQKKRAKTKQLLELQSALRKKEQQHKTNPTDLNLRELNNLGHSIRDLTLEAVSRSILWSKRLFYEKANKTDTLLARALRPRPQGKIITKIRTTDNTLAETPDEINAVFTSYFSELYNHSPRLRATNAAYIADIHQFLSELPKVRKRGGSTTRTNHTTRGGGSHSFPE